MIYRNQQSGFSLVETLVAITILLIVVVGPMTISTSTARSTSFSSEQIQAFFIAQEGLELVQAYRNDELLAELDTADPDPQESWEQFLLPTGDLQECFVSSSDGCGLEIDNDGVILEPIDCTFDSCRLYYNSAGERSRFTHTVTSEPLPFTRIVKIENINDDEVRVISTVSWRSGNLRESQSIQVDTHLFNIYGADI